MSASRQFQFTDEHELGAAQLVETVQDLVAQGNVRTLTVRSETGDIVLSVPLTTGAVAGGIVVLTAPWLALLAAVAGVLVKVRVEVTYDGPEQIGEPQEGNEDD